MTLLFYSIACFGLAYILGFSTITFQVRKWLAARRGAPRLILALIECPACLGFWTGLFLGLHWHDPITWALFTCGSNFILARLTGLILPWEQYE